MGSIIKSRNECIFFISVSQSCNFYIILYFVYALVRLLDKRSFPGARELSLEALWAISRRIIDTKNSRHDVLEVVKSKYRDNVIIIM